MKPAILALVGPTGSGKTSTAIKLCQALNAEIVSMDSMQIYRGMDIGTAKPTPDQLAAAPHHMIDVAEPDELFTVSDYRNKAMKVIDDIHARGKLPILVGGTGLYLNAISYSLTLGSQAADSHLREEYRRIAETENGAKNLFAQLMSVDPQSAVKLHENDVRRVIRALEIYAQTGTKKSEQQTEAKEEGPYHTFVYGLTMPREMMYDKINQRVDEMFENGLVTEVRSLLDRGIVPQKQGGAMQAIGYKEVVSALQGEITMEQARSAVKQNSRRYAKRQWTWFRHDPRTQWFDWTEYDTQEQLMRRLIDTIRSDLAKWNQ